MTGAVTVAPLPPRCPRRGKVLPGPRRGGAGTWARGWRLCRDSRSRLGKAEAGAALQRDRVCRFIVRLATVLSGMAWPGPAQRWHPPLPWQRRRIVALRLRAPRPLAFLNPLRARWRLVSPGRALIGQASRSPPRTDWVGSDGGGRFCALIGRCGRGPAGAAEGAGAGGTRRERRCGSWSPRCYRRRSSLTAAARPSWGLQRAGPALGRGRRGEGRVAALPGPRSARPRSEVPARRRQGPHRPSPAGHNAPGAPVRVRLWV